MPRWSWPPWPSSRISSGPPRLWPAAPTLLRPTVSKLLKQLHRAGLLTSTRGLHGGYQLARPPAQITVAAILDALEGPMTLTDCSGGHGQCGIEHPAAWRPVWQRLNIAIRRALSDVTLAELAGLDSVQPRLPIVGT